MLSAMVKYSNTNSNALLLATGTARGTATGRGRTNSSIHSSHRRLASAALLALTASFHPAQCFSSSSFPTGNTNSHTPSPFVVVPPRWSTTTSTSNCAVPVPAFDLLRGGAAGAGASRSKTTLAQAQTQSAVTETEPSPSPSSNEEMTATASAMTPASKLEALRSRMKELDLDVYIVPSDDPHLSGK